MNFVPIFLNNWSNNYKFALVWIVVNRRMKGHDKGLLILVF